MQHWLDANSRLSRQLKENKDIYELYFSVKFYAVDPCKLVEEITRYHFYLQLRQDVLQGRLPVPFDLASQLGAYVIQCKEKLIFELCHYSYSLLLSFCCSFSQLNLAILTQASTHMDMYLNFALYQIKQKRLSIVLPSFISNLKAWVRRKRNLITWTKSNGSICMALTFIQC